MTEINRLSAVDEVEGGDAFPLFSSAQGDARKASFTTIIASLRTAFSSLIVSSYVTTTATTVANLPSAATAGAGARAMVTDATSTTFNATATGGGANIVPVFSNGTAWRIG